MDSSASHPLVRTRFAPSPTGALHLGNVRVAVFNWLFARSKGGRFILRFEDTDVERNQAGSEEAIMEDLLWLGLEWNEGPDRGGEGAPYRQSEALERYGEAARSLVEAGKAFPCYCTEEELARDRTVESSGAAVHRYSGRCRGLTEVERRRLEAERGVPAIRFQVPDAEVAIDDAVRGEVRFPQEDLSDFVILRPDGRPTYNFAVVVDDVRMAVTHVIRGSGHLSNTPKQLLLFRALSASPPTFAHLPTVLGPEGGRLSKREGSAAVAELRKEGVHPEAVVNYTSLLGWSPPSGEEVLTVEELIRTMDLDRVGASDTMYDPEKLRWMSGQHIARMSLEELVEALRPFVDFGRFTQLGGNLPGAAEAIRTRLRTFAEVNEHLCLLYPESGVELVDARRTVREDDGMRAVVEHVSRRLQEVDPWDAKQLGQALRDAGKEVGAKGPGLFHPLRLALSGERSGPDVSKVLAALGREEALARLQKALEA